MRGSSSRSNYFVIPWHILHNWRRADILHGIRMHRLLVCGIHCSNRTSAPCKVINKVDASRERPDLPGNKWLRVFAGVREAHAYCTIITYPRLNPVFIWQAGAVISKSGITTRPTTHWRVNEEKNGTSKPTLCPSSSHIVPDQTWGEVAADGMPVEKGKVGTQRCSNVSHSLSEVQRLDGGG